MNKYSHIVITYESLDEARLFYKKMSEKEYSFYNDDKDDKFLNWDSFIYTDGRFTLANSKSYKSFMGYKVLSIEEVFKLEGILFDVEQPRIRWYKKGKFEKIN